MQNWVELYKELCTLITENIPAIKWVDLWHNQVNFLDSEHAFPAPATFLGFRIIEVVDLGEKIQKVKIQVTTYLFFETFADTYHGSWNQDDALKFLESLDALYALLHGSSGNTYSGMRRTGMAAVDTGSAGNLYMQPFECTLLDYGAKKVWVDQEVNGIDVEAGITPPEQGEEEEEGSNGYII